MRTAQTPQNFDLSSYVLICGSSCSQIKGDLLTFSSDVAANPFFSPEQSNHEHPRAEPNEPSRAEQALPGSFTSGEKGLLARLLGSFGSFMMLASFARLVANLEITTVPVSHLGPVPDALYFIEGGWG